MPTIDITKIRDRAATFAQTAVVSILVLCASEAAALRNAAGGGGDGRGFARFIAFINRLVDYAIPVGAAFSALMLVWGGSLLMRGDSRASGVLGGVAIGIPVVLLAKAIVA